MGEPLLFIHASVPAAEPFEFYDKLAESYNADLFAADDFRLQLGKDALLRNKQADILVQTAMEEGVIEALSSGRSVVYDDHLNDKEQRDKLRKLVRSKDTGARVVFLCMQAPITTVEARLRERHTNDQLGIPSNLIPDVDELVSKARHTSGVVEWPFVFGTKEDHLRLDGRKSTPELLKSVALYVDKLRFS